MPVVRAVNPLTHADWDNWISEASGAMFFHSAAWARVLHSTYGLTPHYFTLQRENRLLALLPVMDVNSALTGRRGVSLPFTDHCEPLGFSEATSAALIKEALQYGRARRWKYLECRGGTPFGEVAPSTTYFGHKLELGRDTGVLFNRFESSVRRAIRKAEKCGVITEISQTLPAVREYYALHCMTRRHHGLPPQPFRFFLNIHRHVMSQNLGMVATARYQGRPIASTIFFHLGTEALYKFGASDPDFQEFRANNLLMWEAIKSYIGQGKKTLDLGRTSSQGDGLRRYKLGWGAEERPINYYKYDFRKSHFVTAKDDSVGWYNQLFRVLPVHFSRALGALLYKHTA
jgi:lipid II:glycine glycyltransferase (peptidoglycan interpeptide bridge formation enzyme)